MKLTAKGMFEKLGYKKRAFNAIHKQCEELGWLEEKSETNLEHYYNDLLKIGYSTFGVSDGEIKNCNCTACSQCEIRAVDKKEYCRINAIKWLASPYKKPTYKLNKFEYDLINTFDCCKECCLLNEIEALKRMSEKGYFKGIDPFTKVHEILDNCEVIE